MNPAARKLEEQAFVEGVGLFFEQVGFPRKAGRILGRLLISVPPHQSTSELADALVASKGSISTMTRHLIQVGLIERVSLPGVRRDYFRLKPNAWFHLVKQELARMTFLGELADRGYALLEDQEPEMRDRLRELKDVCEFYQRDVPGLVQRWEEQRKQRVEGSR